MAAIDKCYTSSFKDYTDFKNWSEDKTFVTPRGCKINVRDYIYYWWEEKDFIVDGKPYERPIFNTPTIVDNYFYHNCSLNFIQDWLKDRYQDYGYVKGVLKEISEDPKIPEYTSCTKVKVLKKGLGNCPYRGSWHVEVNQENNIGYFWYNENYDFWVLPEENDIWTCSCCFHKGSVKALIRKIIKKWKLPINCTIEVRGMNDRDTWILKTK